MCNKTRMLQKNISFPWFGWELCARCGNMLRKTRFMDSGRHTTFEPDNPNDALLSHYFWHRISLYCHFTVWLGPLTTIKQTLTQTKIFTPLKLLGINFEYGNGRHINNIKSSINPDGPGIAKKKLTMLRPSCLNEGQRDGWIFCWAVWTSANSWSPTRGRKGGTSWSSSYSPYSSHT